MKPKRIFQVYPETHIVDAKTLQPVGYAGPWRFRVIAARNEQIVGGSKEAFDSKGNALRAARREASLYPTGVAAVEVKEA